MAITFPSNPSIGDEYTAGGFTWVWNGTSWNKVAAATGGVANDFALSVGATGNTTYVLDRTYTAGRYGIDFVNDDTTYDIYFIAEDGTYAGYTNNASAQVTADFTEVVVLGATNNETILFTYQGTLTSPSTAGDVATAGAYITSVVTSSLPNIDDTTVVNGGNFAPNVAVAFIGQNSAVTAAKTVVRSSSTQLVVTRPDSFTPTQSPYTVRVLNPGIPAPTGSNAHLATNSVTAGTNPSWVTGTTIVYNMTGSNTITLLATDTEGSDIDYAVTSGTLPAGLTLDGETGVITGTFSGTANDGDSTSVTVRATDAGGNFLDRTFSFVANAAPVWTTAAGALTPPPNLNIEYSFQLVASGGTAGGTLTYTLVSGSLLSGHTMNSTGLISGTSSAAANTVATFTVRVTDQNGLFAERQFTTTVNDPEAYILLASGSLAGATSLSFTNMNHSIYSHYEVHMNYATGFDLFPEYQINGSTPVSDRHDLGRISGGFNQTFQNRNGSQNWGPFCGRNSQGNMDHMEIRMNFADLTTIRKSIQGMSGAVNGTSSDFYSSFKSRITNHTGQINSLSFPNFQGTSFQSGSTFEIYGVKK
jgi:hypothetical protein